MKEFVEKLIGRLEEKFKYNSEQAEIWRNGSDTDSYFREKADLYMDRANIYGETIRIVNQLAEEYGKDTNVTTNADRIRNMSDEELADFLEEFEACDVCKYLDNNRCTFENPCVHEFAGAMIYDWLQSEVKGSDV